VTVLVSSAPALQVRSGRSGIAVDDASAVAQLPSAATVAAADTRRPAANTVQTPPAVVDDPAFTVARERAVARCALADPERSGAEQRRVEGAVRHADRTLLGRGLGPHGETARTERNACRQPLETVADRIGKDCASPRRAALAPPAWRSRSNPVRSWPSR